MSTGVITKINCFCHPFLWFPKVKLFNILYLSGMTKYLQEKTLFGPQISGRIAPNLGIVVVIPCSDEESLLLSLMSLKKCNLPKCSVEVIVVINHGEHAKADVVSQNQKTLQETETWIRENNRPEFKFHLIYHPDLPKKFAGVGLARKIGMDEACWRLEKADNPTGVIVCFDADSKCESNYLTAIESHFEQNPKTTACGIHFEHPLNGLDFEEEVYQAIILYELHLRYYIHAQRFCGFPYAYQTIGSSMAVRANAYQKQGGMNKRKAGEDFYFLHKFIELGSFSEIKTTKVIPSPRPSHRVPFGTGKAVGAILQGKPTYHTYALESFIALKSFFESIPDFYQREAIQVRKSLPKPVAEFLISVDFDKKWMELHKHTGEFQAFEKRLYRWFNSFMLMKYVHFARDHFYPDVEVIGAALSLMKLLDPSFEQVEARKILDKYRELDLQ